MNFVLAVRFGAALVCLTGAVRFGTGIGAAALAAACAALAADALVVTVVDAIGIDSVTSFLQCGH